MSVSSADGSIMISGGHTSATVYNISGIAVAHSGSSESAIIPVEAGIYVVNVDGNTYKVAVH